MWFHQYDADALGRVVKILTTTERHPATRAHFQMKLDQSQGKSSFFDLARKLWIAQMEVTDPYAREDYALQIGASELAHLDHLLDSEGMSPALCAMADEIENHGTCSIDGLLTPSELEDISRYLADKTLGRGGDGTAFYLLSDVFAAPHLLRVVLSPQVLNLAAQYLGAPATLATVDVKRTNPSPVEDLSEQFHRDFHDFRACVLFVNLTDVDEECGPHVYVRNSHLLHALKPRLLRQSSVSLDDLYATRTLSHSAVESVFGSDIQMLVGPAGTGMMEAFSTIHRGSRPTAKSRTMLVAIYTLTPYSKHMKVMAEGGLTDLPRDIADTPLVRHALRYALPLKSATAH